VGVMGLGLFMIYMGYPIGICSIMTHFISRHLTNYSYLSLTTTAAFSVSS
jgi:hypothetical protein